MLAALRRPARRPRSGRWRRCCSSRPLTVPFLGEEFLPNFRENDFLMHWVEKPGTSLEAMRRITERASRELRAIPGVRNFGAHIGRAEVADEVVGPNFTELWISIDPPSTTRRRSRRSVDRRRLSRAVSRPADVSPRAHQGSADRGERDDRRPRYGPTSKCCGHRPRGARRDAKVAGVADLKVQAQVLVPQVEVRFGPDARPRSG